jgi:hypothetical protein
VERGGELADGRRFADFVEFREMLTKQPEVIARGIAGKLLVYGCGRPVTAADRAAVDLVVTTAQRDDFGLRSMIHAVVDSEMFLRP